MELYIGGYAQGKLSFVRNMEGSEDVPVVTGTERLKGYGKGERIVFHRFHEWFLARLQAGGSPEDEMDRCLEEYKGLVIICDEVGNGIVPMQAQEREYRERLGRYLCRLAQQAVRVERIICGIGQRIK